MRELILHRERALACFAVKYYCLIDQNQADFLQKLEGKDQEQMMLAGDGTPLRNGETIHLEIDENEHSFFVAVYLESRNMITDAMVIPAGEKNAEFKIRTDFNGDKKLNLFLEAC